MTENNPYKNLWSAVLDRAMQDIKGIIPGSEKYREKKIIKEAEDWFGSDDRDIGSFLWVCEILDLQPDKVLMLTR